MRLVQTYSSWTRNRITPDLRAAIANAGEGEVRYGPAIGKPRGWVACSVRTPDGDGSGVGPNPHAAFNAAMARRTPVLSLLSGGAA